MVIAVRCPSAACRKYMMVEPHERGTIVPCLICKLLIPVPALDGSMPKAGQPKPAPFIPTLQPKPAPVVMDAEEILEPVFLTDDELLGLE
jgi:hypothetical protein